MADCPGPVTAVLVVRRDAKVEKLTSAAMCERHATEFMERVESEVHEATVVLLDRRAQAH